jgi:hypothetical protein
MPEITHDHENLENDVAGTPQGRSDPDLNDSGGPGHSADTHGLADTTQDNESILERRANQQRFHGSIGTATTGNQAFRSRGLVGQRHRGEKVIKDE